MEETRNRMPGQTCIHFKNSECVWPLISQIWPLPSNVTPPKSYGYIVYMTDAALVARILEGDRAAGAELVNRYYAGCWGYAFRLVGNREDADDAMQETFLRAFRSLHSYQERHLFRAWLYRILTNQCRTIMLQRRRRQQRFIADEVALQNALDPSTHADAVLDEDEQIDMIDKLQYGLACLEPMQREAFLLKYGEQLEYTEMAEITGSSISALKMRVKRACDTLRPLIQEVTNA